ncbi:MAG TPA: dihydrofolate reductase family protein [Gemmatimonadales bacterium]|nr:dihydrofolate reductase family protein [Gemmatimonadales bacterium]
MSKVRVANFAISVDGYSSAPGQSLEHPFGPGGLRVMEWFFPTESFQKMQGKPGGETGVDNDFSRRSMTGIGAWILGRNMFGPIRGPWPDDQWKGWWGPNPPYHVPTFVLTHHPRPPITMEGGTVFHFVTDGVESALRQARAAAGDKDIRIGGGATTVRQYLQARLIDEMHLVQSPVLLGGGESIFAGTDLHALGYEVTERVTGERATHLMIRKRP